MNREKATARKSIHVALGSKIAFSGGNDQIADLLAEDESERAKLREQFTSKETERDKEMIRRMRGRKPKGK